MEFTYNNIENKVYKNFFGGKSEFEKEFKSAIYKNSCDGDVFWIHESNNIYYLKYACDQCLSLKKFISKAEEFIEGKNCLLEIKLQKGNKYENWFSILAQLKRSSFVVASHHISLVKEYFKDMKDSSVSIRKITSRDIWQMSEFINSIDSKHRNITSGMLEYLTNNPNRLIFAYMSDDKTTILGYILVSIDKNIEKIGFIRELNVKSNEDLQTIGRALINYSLNKFHEMGFNKAFVWNEAGLIDIKELFLKYGFKEFGTEIAVFTRSSHFLNTPDFTQSTSKL